MTASVNAPEAVTARGSSRWLWAVMLASLAVNCVVVGVVAGAVVRERRMGGPPVLQGSGPTGVFAYVQTLPPERALQLRTVFAKARVGLEPVRGELVKARAELQRLLLAETFDKDAYVAADRHLGELESRQREINSRVQADAMAELNGAERRQFVAWRAMRQAGGRGAGDRQPEPK